MYGDPSDESPLPSARGCSLQHSRVSGMKTDVNDTATKLYNGLGYTKREITNTFDSLCGSQFQSLKMVSRQVVDTSVTTTNSPSRDYTNPYDEPTTNTHISQLTKLLETTTSLCDCNAPSKTKPCKLQLLQSLVWRLIVSPETP